MLTDIFRALSKTLFAVALVTMAFPAARSHAQERGPVRDPNDKVVAELTQTSEIYTAVWREDGEPARLLTSADPPSFATPGGYELSDVEVWLEQESRRYLGIFRPAAGGSSVLEGPATTAEFETIRSQRHRAGFCLAGFELWRENGRTFQAGVFQPGCPAELYESALDVVEFSAKLQQHASTHHLVDFETVVAGGILKVSGVWHPGPETSQVYALLGVAWETFHDGVHDLTQQGYGLVDLDVQFQSSLATTSGSRPGRLRERRATGVARHPGAHPSVATVSGVWRATTGSDWLAANFHRDHLDCAHRKLSLGTGDDGVPHFTEDKTDAWGSSCEAGSSTGQIVTPTGPSRYLVAIEASSPIASLAARIADDLRDPGDTIPDHDGTLHNSGTAGPP